MIFQFKQFSVKQSDSAMKVGTDGLLLATSTPLLPAQKEILDIGSGTGLISLILAQRNARAQITAIEVDEAAALESTYNFENSSFAERLECLHSSFQNYLKQSPSQKYDLIISNPPFFKGSQAEGSRKLARKSEILPLSDLIRGVKQLLSISGQFSLILPYVDEEEFLSNAKTEDLYPFEILRIRGRKDSKLIRSILHLRHGKQALEEKEMHIEVDQRHQYSEDYKELVREFLLER